MCEYGLQYFPQSSRIYAILTKLYTKLGLVKMVDEMSQKFPTAPATIF
jgi:hypothetical protein